MARLPRLVLPQHPHHITLRALDGLAALRDADDYLAFLKWLREAARQFKVAIHAYVLMPGEVQLLASPADTDGLGRMMQWLGRHYVPYFNNKYQRAGTLWQGRYRATLVEADQFLITCSQYIETAPVRAGLAPAAADYAWSSALHHIGLKPDPVITDHALYWALGNTPFDREAAYRARLEQGLGAEQIRLLDAALHKGWPLGSDLFKQGLSKKVSRRVVPGRRGRPRKADSPTQKV